MCRGEHHSDLPTTRARECLQRQLLECSCHATFHVCCEQPAGMVSEALAPHPSNALLFQVEAQAVHRLEHRGEEDDASTDSKNPSDQSLHRDAARGVGVETQQCGVARVDPQPPKLPIITPLTILALLGP